MWWCFKYNKIKSWSYRKMQLFCQQSKALINPWQSKIRIRISALANMAYLTLIQCPLWWRGKSYSRSKRQAKPKILIIACLRSVIIPVARVLPRQWWKWLLQYQEFLTALQTLFFSSTATWNRFHLRRRLRLRAWTLCSSNLRLICRILII